MSEHEDGGYSDEYYDDLDDDADEESFDEEGRYRSLRATTRTTWLPSAKAAWTASTATAGGTDNGGAAKLLQNRQIRHLSRRQPPMGFAAGEPSREASPRKTPASDAEVEHSGTITASSPSAEALDEDVDVNVDVDVDFDVGGDHYDLETLLDQRSWPRQMSSH